MKKLSLVLALVLVLTCALAACGGDSDTTSSGAPVSKPASSTVASSEAPASSEASVESSEGSVDSPEPPVESTEAPVESTEAPVESTEAPVESTEAPVESTEAPVESTEAPVESTEAPVESTEAPVESSEPEVSEPETSEPETGDSTNVALGIKYDAFGYEVAGGDWPASYTADLTDGVALGEVSFDNQWFAFCASAGDKGLNTKDGVGTVILDLGKETSITKVRVNTLFGKNVDESGVNGPAKITAFVGDAAGNYTELGVLTSNLTEGVGYAELNCAGKGQFVKIEVTLDGIFAFLNEIEVYN